MMTTTSAHLDHVCCTVNGRLLAMAMHGVREIIPATTLMPLPLMPSWVMGLMHLRGTPLVILNLDQCLHIQGPQSPQNSLTRHAQPSRHACILVVSAQLEWSPDSSSDDNPVGTQPIGLWVDRVHDIINASPEQTVNTPTLGHDMDVALIETTLLCKGQPIPSINLQQLLHPQRLGQHIGQHVSQTAVQRLRLAEFGHAP
jgi:chemotaxis signal transduction protein